MPDLKLSAMPPSSESVLLLLLPPILPSSRPPPKSAPDSDPGATRLPPLWVIPGVKREWTEDPATPMVEAPWVQSGRQLEVEDVSELIGITFAQMTRSLTLRAVIISEALGAAV